LEDSINYFEQYILGLSYNSIFLNDNVIEKETLTILLKFFQLNEYNFYSYNLLGILYFYKILIIK
jgi:hypothetical protein